MVRHGTQKKLRSGRKTTRKPQKSWAERQKNAVARGSPSLGHTLLVAGMQRHIVDDALGGTLAAHHRIHFGSHLVVIAPRPEGLWRVSRQRELMYAHGCSVQLEVFFDDPESSQQYILEANVPGPVLAGESQCGGLGTYSHRSS